MPLGRPQDVSAGRFRTWVGHAPCSYRLEHMGRLHNVWERRPKDVSRRRPLALHTRNCWDVIKTLHWDVLRMSYFNVQRTTVDDFLRTSAGNVPWLYINEHMVTSIGHLLGTPSGLSRDVILPSRHPLFWKFC